MRILEALLEQQRHSGFPDLAGTEVAATIPVADRLLNELIARLLPHDGTRAGYFARPHDFQSISACRSGRRIVVV